MAATVGLLCVNASSVVRTIRRESAAARAPSAPAASPGESPLNAFKVVVPLLLVAIVVSLGEALFHTSRGDHDSGQLARALSVRLSQRGTSGG